MLSVSCSSNNNFEISPQEITEHQLIAKTANELAKEKELILVGIGGSSLPGYEHIEINFDYFYPLNIDKARHLIIFIANRFLENLNSDDNLKKFQSSPYKMQNIKIMIFCYMPNKSNARPPNLGSIWLTKNKISYNLREEYDLQTIHEETYEEALHKLKL